MKAELQLPKRLVIPETRHHMYLNVMPFNFALLTLGCFGSAEAARVLGMKTPKTIDRAREGGAVSGELMGNVMAVFRLNAERLEASGIAVALDTFFTEGAREDREPHLFVKDPVAA